MEVQTNEQTATSAQAAEAETGKTGALASGNASLGKFKDTGALLDAYKSLESEFTRRCRRLSELEGRLLRDNKAELSDKESEHGAKAAEKTALSKEPQKNAETPQSDFLQGGAETLRGNGAETPQSDFLQSGAELENCMLKEESGKARDLDGNDGNAPLKNGGERQDKFAKADAAFASGNLNDGLNVNAAELGTEAKFITSGNNTQPQILKPKSLKEAGKLALQNFKNFNKGE